MRFDKRDSKKVKKGYTWRVTFDYKDQYGISKRYSKSGFETKKDAEKHARKKLAELEKGRNVASQDKRLDEVYEEWLDVGAGKLRLSTLATYKSAYKCHVHPVLGQAKVKDLGYVALQKFFNSLSGNGSESVSRVRKVLKSVLTFALRAGYIDYIALDQVEAKGNVNKKERPEYLTYQQFLMLEDELLSSAKDLEGYSRIIFLYLGYYLGLRMAEILGLTFDRINFDTRELTVSQQLDYHTYNRADYQIIHDLKKDSSYATLPMPEPLYDALVQWREYNPYPLVCCRQDGSFLTVQQNRSKIQKAAKTAGVDFHPHMLRHTFITNLIKAGADPKTAMTLARHKDVSTTLEIYTEVNQESKTEILKKAFEYDKNEKNSNFLA